MAETPWMIQAAKPKAQIKTVNEAAAYTHHSMIAAAKKCPAAADKYKTLRTEIVDKGLLGPLGTKLTGFTMPIWQAGIKLADGACTAARDSVGRQTATDKTYVPDRKAANEAPPLPASLGGGSDNTGLLIWGLGGLALFFLFNKKSR